MKSDKRSTVYLIPSFLDPEATDSLPYYIIDAVKDCQLFFVENERSARRFLKKIWKEMTIDDYGWHTLNKENDSDPIVLDNFRKAMREAKNIGIISEAGCPGIADPGQVLVALAQAENARVKPLVGPSSILLALMASGMNGQQFHFCGYLPIDKDKRIKAIRELEKDAEKNNCTQVFIETPYRNNAMLAALLQHCHPNTRLCIAAGLTGANESIRTQTISEWKK
ncbi:MAG TPA: SAM-dependent methyltransferase, partial [Chitinophagaceae bacterium]|nr:SAM-dependent methyltransferase [Chitinophagaceae bacterium]